MASKVNVPMNFGKHLRDSPTHNTLKINTSEGGEVLASSVILSFNSPVIDHMTTTLHMTSLDMLEFSEAAVQVFVDAAYSGTAEGITKELFRDINKIAHVFEMSWLVDKCADYFKLLVDSVKQTSQEELLFVFEEAEYMSEHLNKQDFLDLTIKKIEIVGCKREFLEKYLKDAEKLSPKKLDTVIKLAGTDVHIVVQAVVNQLTELFKVQTTTLQLPKPYQYLLENSNLSLCRKTDKDLIEKLFDVLSSLPDEYMRWTFGLLRKFKQEDVTKFHKIETNAIKSKESLPVVKQSPQSTSVGESSRSQGKTVVDNAHQTLQHLGHTLDFEELKSLEDLVCWISASENVSSLMMAVEAIATWRQFNINKIPKLRPIILSKLYTRLTDMADERGWPLLPNRLRGYQFRFGKFGENKHSGSFMSQIYHSFVDSFYLSKLCQSSEKQPCPYVIFDSLTNFKFPISFLENAGSKLVFHFEHPAVAPCKQLSDCGFILETAPKSNNDAKSFLDVRLCTDKNEYYKEDMHLHDDVIRVEKIQLCLNCTKYGENDLKFLIPLSWLGWLTNRNQDEWINNTGIGKNFSFTSRFAVLYDVSH